MIKIQCSLSNDVARTRILEFMHLETTKIFLQHNNLYDLYCYAFNFNFGYDRCTVIHLITEFFLSNDINPKDFITGGGMWYEDIYESVDNLISDTNWLIVQYGLETLNIYRYNIYINFINHE